MAEKLIAAIEGNQSGVIGLIVLVLATPVFFALGAIMNDYGHRLSMSAGLNLVLNNVLYEIRPTYNCSDSEFKIDTDYVCKQVGEFGIEPYIPPPHNFCYLFNPDVSIGSALEEPTKCYPQMIKYGTRDTLLTEASIGKLLNYGAALVSERIDDIWPYSSVFKTGIIGAGFGKPKSAPTPNDYYFEFAMIRVRVNNLTGKPIGVDLLPKTGPVTTGLLKVPKEMMYTHVGQIKLLVERAVNSTDILGWPIERCSTPFAVDPSWGCDKIYLHSYWLVGVGTIRVKSRLPDFGWMPEDTIDGYYYTSSYAIRPLQAIAAIDATQNNKMPNSQKKKK